MRVFADKAAEDFTISIFSFPFTFKQKFSSILRCSPGDKIYKCAWREVFVCGFEKYAERN